MSDSGYLGLALLTAVVAAAAQYGGWLRFGGRRATEGTVAERRDGLRAWVRFALAWQALVLVFAVAYVAIGVAAHARGAVWAAPAIGAVVGTALPLQVVVVSLLRALR